MFMKRNLLRNSIIAIIGILAFIGCATQKGVIGDWQDISSLDQLVGKWEGSINIQVPYDEENFVPESSIEISISIEYAQGAQEIFGEMKVDMDKLVSDMLAMGLEAGISEEEISKDLLWATFLEGASEELEGFVIGDQYYLTLDLSGDAEEALQSDDEIKLQAHVNGTQIRLVLSETLSFGFGEEEFKELVLNKR